MIALEEARSGMVLLKNENGVLPLDRNKVKAIAVLGPWTFQKRQAWRLGDQIPLAEQRANRRARRLARFHRDGAPRMTVPIVAFHVASLALAHDDSE